MQVQVEGRVTPSSASAVCGPGRVPLTLGSPSLPEIPQLATKDTTGKQPRPLCSQRTPMLALPPHQGRTSSPSASSSASSSNTHQQTLASNSPRRMSKGPYQPPPVAGPHYDIIATSRASPVRGPNGSAAAGTVPPRPPRAPFAPSGGAGGSGSSSTHVPTSAPRSSSPLVPYSSSHHHSSSTDSFMGRSTRQVVYSSLPGAPPLLPPSSSASSFRSTRRRQPTSPSTDQFDDHENDVEEGDSDASSFKDEEVADLGSSSEDEFVRPPVRIRDASGPMGPGGTGESSAESLGRVIGGVEGKEEGEVRDWLGVSLPVRSTSKSGLTTVDAVQPPPRSSSTADPPRPRSPLTPPLTGSTSQIAPPPRSQSHGRSTSKSSSINDQLRRELPALHTSFEPAPSAKEREHQQDQALRKKEGVSPPPYAHSLTQGGAPSVQWANNEHKQALLGPPSIPSSSRATDREVGDGHAHRDGYTNSPSLFRLPDLAANSKSLDFGAAPGPDGEGLFDPTSFNLAQFARPSGFVGLLVESRVVRTLLAESTISDVVALWQSLTAEEQRTVERERDVVEEVRVWGLGWAGYVRGAGKELELKGGWDRVGVNVVLDFCEFPFSRLCLPRP